MSEGLRGALNAILFRTGDQSRDFAVVLATNRPGANCIAAHAHMQHLYCAGCLGPSRPVQNLLMQPRR